MAKNKDGKDLLEDEAKKLDKRIFKNDALHLAYLRGRQVERDKGEDKANNARKWLFISLALFLVCCLPQIFLDSYPKAILTLSILSVVSAFTVTVFLSKVVDPLTTLGFFVLMYLILLCNGNATLKDMGTLVLKFFPSP